MMTALEVVASVDLDEEVTVSATAAAVPGGKLSLLPGERWSVRELLQGLLIASSNDAAVALAEHVAGNEDAFVQRMNERAAVLGLEETSFTTSHGLDEPGHSASARDLAVLGAELLRAPELAEMVASTRVEITSSQRTAALENTNLLLESYPGADGVKTGFTALAGNVLVASSERFGRRLIAVAMHSEDAFLDAAELLDLGFRKLKRGVLLEALTVHGAVVSDAGAVSAVASGTVRGPEVASSLSISFEALPQLALPIEEGQIIGQINLEGADGVLLDSVPARSSGTLLPQETDWRSDLLEEILATAGGWLGR